MPSVRGSFGCYETASGSRELRKTECSSAKKECAHIREKSVWMCGVGRAILCQCCVLLAFCSPASPAAYHLAAAPPSLHQAFSTKRFPVPPLLPLPISLQFHLGSPRSAVAVLFLGNEACLSFAADHVLSFSSSDVPADKHYSGQVLIEYPQKVQRRVPLTHGHMRPSRTRASPILFWSCSCLPACGRHLLPALAY